MDKWLSVYMKYGETIYPNHFEMCPIRIVYGRNNSNLVECSRILVEILRASRSRFYHKYIYNCREEELKFIREPPTKLFIHRLKFRGEGLLRHQLILVSH